MSAIAQPVRPAPVRGWPARTVTAHRPVAVSVVFNESDALVCEALIPGFRLPVADVFRD